MATSLAEHRGTVPKEYINETAGAGVLTVNGNSPDGAGNIVAVQTINSLSPTAGNIIVQANGIYSQIGVVSAGNVVSLSAEHTAGNLRANVIDTSTQALTGDGTWRTVPGSTTPGTVGSAEGDYIFTMCMSGTFQRSAGGFNHFKFRLYDTAASATVLQSAGFLDGQTGITDGAAFTWSDACSGMVFCNDLATLVWQYNVDTNSGSVAWNMTFLRQAHSKLHNV